MRKLISLILICLIILSGCTANESKEATEAVGQTQIGNPWKSYEALVDAEHACGLTFPLSDHIPNEYVVGSYRVMSNSLLEVTYQNSESKITVRMQAGNDLDISGVYETFHHTETTEQNGASVTRKEAADSLVYLVQKDGYSFSIHANSPTAEEACREILSYIC